MMRPFFYLLLLGGILSSCSTLLNADFQTTAVGENPPSDLPGPPDGDRLHYSPTADNSQPLEIIDLEARGQRALRILPVYSRPVFFESIEAGENKENFQISFTAIPTSTITSGLLISFAADTLQTIATVRMQDGEVALRVEENGDFRYEKLGAFLPDERQTFILNMNLPEKEYTLNIIRESNPELRVEEMPFPEAQQLSTPVKLRLYFEYMNPDNSMEETAWIVDDVQMQQQ